MHRPIRLTVLIALLVSLVAAAQTAAAEGRQTYTGTLGGAKYHVEVPQRDVPESLDPPAFSVFPARGDRDFSRGFG